jgi:hypothetical protein
MKNVIRWIKTLLHLLFFFSPLTVGFPQASAQGGNGYIEEEVLFANDETIVNGTGRSQFLSFATSSAQNDAKSKLRPKCDADFIAQKNEFESALRNLGVIFFVREVLPYENQSLEESWNTTEIQTDLRLWIVDGYYLGKYARRVKYWFLKNGLVNVSVIKVSYTNPSLLLSAAGTDFFHATAQGRAETNATRIFRPSCLSDYANQRRSFEASMTAAGIDFIVLEEGPFIKEAIFAPFAVTSSFRRNGLWYVEGNFSSTYTREVRYMIIVPPAVP